MTMTRSAAGASVALLAILGGSLILARPETGKPGAQPRVTLEGTTRHVVTPPMVESGRAMVERLAAPIEAQAADGSVYHLDELRRRGPVVRTFVKDGYPCSASARPYFNRLVVAHPDVQFPGSVDVEKATVWAGKHRVSCPILLDPASKIVRAYQAKNSAYVVPIDSEGRIREHWPGYSAGMLRKLGATLAELTGTGERPIDLADAPSYEYTGCPFDL